MRWRRAIEILVLGITTVVLGFILGVITVSHSDNRITGYLTNVMHAALWAILVVVVLLIILFLARKFLVQAIFGANSGTLPATFSALVDPVFDSLKIPENQRSKAHLALKELSAWIGVSFAFRKLLLILGVAVTIYLGVIGSVLMIQQNSLFKDQNDEMALRGHTERVKLSQELRETLFLQPKMWTASDGSATALPNLKTAWLHGDKVKTWPFPNQAVLDQLVRQIDIQEKGNDRPLVSVIADLASDEIPTIAYAALNVLARHHENSAKQTQIGAVNIHALNRGYTQSDTAFIAGYIDVDSLSINCLSTDELILKSINSSGSINITHTTVSDVVLESVVASSLNVENISIDGSLKIINTDLIQTGCTMTNQSIEITIAGKSAVSINLCSSSELPNIQDVANSATLTIHAAEPLWSKIPENFRGKKLEAKLVEYSSCPTEKY